MKTYLLTTTDTDEKTIQGTEFQVQGKYLTFFNGNEVTYFIKNSLVASVEITTS